jgi:MerR family transcriptional regulator, light-induced transcriptional regulator
MAADFSLRLKELRLRRALRQKDLAAALGLAQTTIANYEQKLRFPDEGTLVRIADYFGVSLDHLMGRDNGYAGGLPAGAAEAAAAGSERPVPEAAREFLSAFRAHGTEAARVVLQGAVSRGAGMRELYLDVFAPALREVGRLWAVGELSVGEEHAFSEATQRLMSQHAAIASATSPARPTGLRCVAVSASGESHLIGVRMVADFLASAGWEVSFPGGNLSIRHLRELLLARPPSLLALSVTLAGNLNAAADLVRALRGETSLAAMRVMAGGQAFAARDGKDVGADASADDAEGAVKAARDLFGLT